MKNKYIFLCFLLTAAVSWAQGIQDNSSTAANVSESSRANVTQLPLKKVVILTSGLAYYEYAGSVSGSVSINFPFKLNAVNDALKTLIINDSASANPSVTYQAENTLIETLRSLSVDISDNPDLAVILSRLRGAEADVNKKNISYSADEENVPSSIIFSAVHTGRITGIEKRQIQTPYSMGGVMETYLVLSTENGFVSIPLTDIISIKFKDPVIERDINRALDLISASRSSTSRQLTVNLPGNASGARRNVSISYVIPSPVWKVSYRLDLGQTRPLLQGWAIIDNDSDTDWNNVTLSLVTGRPASFIQELYPPYYVSRPVLPLLIAGAAQGLTHDKSAPVATTASPAPMSARSNAVEESYLMESFDMSALSEMERSRITGGAVQTAAGNQAGGQFEFTIRNPVNLDRRMSAMFPLVESNIEAKKTLIYSSGRFPRLGAEIINTSKMKLPAGPITVYDGGVYAGDALIEFWNEDEKRLISFGEDLSVTASTSDTNTRAVNTVTVTGGVMTINRYQTFSKTYTFINSSSTEKPIIVEHAKNSQSDLVSPQATEQTATHYRFNITLRANRETTLTVNEKRPVSERVTLVSLRPDALLSYSTNQEIPSNVRQALSRAVELKQAADAAAASVKDIETQRTRLIADQDRVRRNLEAAGSQTPQGQNYLERLVSLDKEIDDLTRTIERAENNAKAAQVSYENYLNTLRL